MVAVICSGLSLSNIVELIWYWPNLVSVTNATQWTGRSKATAIDWYNLCRDVCNEIFDKRKKMYGPGLKVQIDESLFQGKRKYNRGRCLNSDRRPTSASNDSTDDDEAENTQSNHN